MKILASILSIFLFFSCKINHPVNDDIPIEELPQSLPIIELASGTNGGFQNPINKVITTQEEFTSTWEMVYANYMNAEKQPQVDFEKYQVILVAMGTKNSGGYSIKVTSLNNTFGNLFVNVEETSPDNNCATTTALTFPFQLIQVKKSTGKTTFNITKKVIKCKPE